MKVVRIYGKRDLRLSDEPIPTPAPGMKLLRVKSVGICGSDLHWYSEGNIGTAKLTRPLVLGHEFSAVLENGERVAVDPALPCGKCESCLKGHPNICPNVKFAGGDEDGALRDYIPWAEECIFPIPDNISDEDGAMLEPLGVAIHSVDLAHLKPGMTVGVFGCGPIGLLIIQLARLCGASNILATDVLPHRVEAAKACGATHAWCVQEQLEPQAWQAATHGRGVDVAFDVSGAKGAVNDAVDTAIPGGKVILAGIPEDDQTGFKASVARRKGLTLKLVRRMKHTYPRAIDLVIRGLVDVRSLVSHCFPLEGASEAFESAEKREGLKVVINL